MVQCPNCGKNSHSYCSSYLVERALGVFDVRCRWYNAKIIGYKQAIEYAKSLTDVFGRWAYVEFCGIVRKMEQ